MNYRELLVEISRKTSLKQPDVNRVFKSFAEITARELNQGNIVTLVDIGSLTTMQCKEHTGTNPKTGEKILISTKNRVKLKPCVALKNAVNRGKM